MFGEKEKTQGRKTQEERTKHFLKHPCLSSLESKEVIYILFSSQSWMIIQATLKM